MVRPPARPRILAICAVDIMAWVLLKPWLSALRDRGFEVHIACSQDRYFDALGASGFHMHAVHLRRSFNPLAHIRPFIELLRLMRSKQFPIVNTHSPVAAAVGRMAAWFALANTTIIYTVHGFYFHDRMPRLQRTLFVTIEWLLGRFTDAFMFASDEDRRTAAKLGITGPSAITCTIFNGVDLDTFCPRARRHPKLSKLRRLHDIPERPVIGTVGRIVKEKGYRELLGMASRLTSEGIDATYLVVGDSLPSDRDQFGQQFRRMVADAGLATRFVFTGMTDRVADYLAIMDVFVLASYREGFPRSVLEAMATGLPVVATNIRGCREAVVDGVSGLIVPPCESTELTNAVRRLISDPHLRMAMGNAGRALAVEKFDSRIVQRRFAEFVATASIAETALPREAIRTSARLLKNATDWGIAACLLLILAPVMLSIRCLITVAMGRPVLFRHPRIGLGGRPFTFFKFRTMTDARDASGRPLPDAQRLTRLGRFLRSTSLDELPQFWNVLCGEMSLVGPRPLLPQYLPRYNAHQHRRHEVKPGITGWAQINGRNALTWEEKFDLDVWYVDHQSFWLDVKILWLTLLKVLRRDGISQNGYATMPEFMGTARASESHE
jgi:lipopolysaccharide/colanic/teichoic acid biosynthesis glycosyltransferase